jgi:uncharacterized protein YkwD
MSLIWLPAAWFPTTATALLLLVIAPPKDPSAGLPERTLHPVELQIVSKTNAQRARYGLQPLVVDGALLRSARSHAIWMTRNHCLTHTRQAVAENIAMGQATASEAVQDWMSSPGHRMNILHGGHTRIGVAAYVATDGMIYWCQQFLP